MATRKWNDLSKGQKIDKFEEMSETNPGYAIAWALFDLADQQKKTASALDRMGLNYEQPAGPPGTTESIAMQLKDLVEVFQHIERTLNMKLPDPD